LHIACGDITDVSMVDGVFVIKTTEDYLYQLLDNDENKKQLKTAFNMYGIKQFKILKKEKTISVAQQDLLILKRIVGDKLEIEGEWYERI